jgi:hypothetical protein
MGEREAEAWVNQLFAPLVDARRVNWDVRHEQPPHVLYHYTDAKGLQGIVESQRLWASNAAFLNDATELVYVDHVIHDVLESLRSEATGVAAKAFIDRGQGGTLGSEGFFEVYVACFCTNGDLLSQWRGYPPAGGGYAVGLRTAMLHFHQQEGIHLRRVVYEAAEQRRLVEGVLHPVLEGLESRESSSGGDTALQVVPRCLQLARAHFAEFAFCFKHPAFREEDEWRLIQVQSRLDGHPQSTVHLRPAETGLVPYVEYELPDRAGVFTGRLPIKEIVVGPAAHRELAKRAVWMLLEINDYPWTHTPVTASEIPLRV